MKSELLVFDLDGTLLNIDSTWAFLFFTSRKSFKYFLVTFFFFMLHIFGFKKQNYLVKKLLSFYTNNEIDNSAGVFVKKILKSSYLNRNLFKLFKKNRNRSLVASNGFPFIVKKFSEELKVRYICAKKIGSKIDKYDYLKKIFKKKIIYDVYTDNFNDKKLVLNSNNAIIIHKNYRQVLKWKRYLKNKKFHFYNDTGTKPIINKKNYFITYVPGLYYFLSRNKNNFLLNSFLKEIVPIYILFGQFDLKIFFLVICSYFVMLMPYELGIIDNDYISVWSEDTPTQRIDPKIHLNIFLFKFLRIMMIAVYLMVSKKLIYILLSLLIVCIFHIHNNLSKTKRFYTYLFLRIMKTICFVVLILPPEKIILGFLIIFTIEHFKSVVRYYRQGFRSTFKEDLFYTTILYLIILSIINTWNFLSLYLLLLLILYYIFISYRFFRNYVFIK